MFKDHPKFPVKSIENFNSCPMVHKESVALQGSESITHKGRNQEDSDQMQSIIT